MLQLQRNYKICWEFLGYVLVGKSMFVTFPAWMLVLNCAGWGHSVLFAYYFFGACVHADCISCVVLKSANSCLRFTRLRYLLTLFLYGVVSNVSCCDGRARGGTLFGEDASCCESDLERRYYSGDLDCMLSRSGACFFSCSCVLLVY